MVNSEYITEQMLYLYLFLYIGILYNLLNNSHSFYCTILNNFYDLDFSLYTYVTYIKITIFIHGYINCIYYFIYL